MEIGDKHVYCRLRIVIRSNGLTTFDVGVCRANTGDAPDEQMLRFLSTVTFGLKAMESESTILNLYIGERIQLLGDNGIDVLASLPNSIHCANHSLFHWY